MISCAMKVFLCITCAVMLLSCCIAQEDPKLSAREELNQGVVAYRAGETVSAAAHFRKATELDPDLRVAHLYLATAFAQQFIPGVDAPDNLIMAKQAIDEYQKVLQNDPGNINSLKGIAYIFMNTKQFDDSLAYYKKVVAADPNDAEAYYSVGVVDWTVVFKETTTLKARAGLRVEDDVKAPRNQKLCDDLRTSNQEHIEEGLTMLRKAVALRADYSDAMVYVNLLYRRKADIDCNDPKARAADLKAAEHWADLAMSARQGKTKPKTSPTEEPEHH